MTIYSEIAANKNRTRLLMASFIVAVIALGWLFSQVFDQPLILVAAVVIALVQSLASYYYSAAITLAVSGARAMAAADDPELYHILENLAITAGIPMPGLYMIEDTAPNAFATGRDPEHAAIAVTRGLREKLTRAELEGVLAHEMSHVRNYDIRLMTIIVVLVGVVALLSDWFLRWTFWSGSGRKRRSGEGGGQAEIILLAAALMLAILAPLAATLIKLALSRRREYLADASGALLTRYPEGLASALEKISADPEPLEVANKATAHLYIANPLKGRKGIMNGLFSTHPPVQERISKLRSML